ncbi:hypothetical protein H5410_021518 [Solanum commersonii]|uniref:Uncharacterized protein n=1 Tax=Solanum commersonii TaxID=4109 RepID=A0A9J5ZCU1_SOLCO|nr:hypothetical protein H5410_021518 [Solanum commersonii]
MSQTVLQKTQHECTDQDSTTHALINYALKDSSCDSPLLRMLKFTILASNATASSTKVVKCPYNKDDSILTHNFSTIHSSGSTYDSHTHKDEHMHDFTYRFALIFQSTFFSAHSRPKRESILGVSLLSGASVPGVREKLAPLEPAMDVSTSDV